MPTLIVDAVVILIIVYNSSLKFESNRPDTWLTTIYIYSWLKKKRDTF